MTSTPDSTPKTPNPSVGEKEVVIPDGFGLDSTDTSRGNGSFIKDPEALSAMRDMHIQHRRELKDARTEAYQEGMKDALRDAASLHANILKTGVELAERASQGMIMSQQERELLKLAQSSANEVANRGVGRAKTTHEEHKTVSILSLMLEARKEIEG